MSRRAAEVVTVERDGMGAPDVSGPVCAGSLPPDPGQRSRAGLLSLQTRTEWLSISQVSDHWPWPRLDEERLWRSLWGSQQQRRENSFAPRQRLPPETT